MIKVHLLPMSPLSVPTNFTFQGWLYLRSRPDTMMSRFAKRFFFVPNRKNFTQDKFRLTNFVTGFFHQNFRTVFFKKKTTIFSSEICPAKNFVAFGAISFISYVFTHGPQRNPPNFSGAKFVLCEKI